MAAWAAPPQQNAKKTTTVAELKAQQQVQGEPVPDKGRTQNNSADSSAHNNRRHNEDALSDSIRRIERSTRGQVLSAERVPYEGRNLNRIKVVDAQGRVRVYMDDPQPKPVSEPLPTHSDDE